MWKKVTYVLEFLTNNIWNVYSILYFKSKRVRAHFTCFFHCASSNAKYTKSSKQNRYTIEGKFRSETYILIRFSCPKLDTHSILVIFLLLFQFMICLRKSPIHEWLSRLPCLPIRIPEIRRFSFYRA